MIKRCGPDPNTHTHHSALPLCFTCSHLECPVVMDRKVEVVDLHGDHMKTRVMSHFCHGGPYVLLDECHGGKFYNTVLVAGRHVAASSSATDHQDARHGKGLTGAKLF